MNPIKNAELTFFSLCQESSFELPLFLTAVKAGFPSPADDFIDQKLDLNQYLIRHPAATFFVRVEGDSMKNAGIRKGDLLIVDRALEASNGKIVIAIVNGDFTVKRLRVDKDSIYLEAENQLYPSLLVTPDSDFTIWGLVTYIIHKAF